MLNKPTWLRTEEYRQLIEKVGTDPSCAHCGTELDLSVDHIIPRYEGGTNDANNLQVLCRSCNSRKGTRPDAYWSREFYWDLPIRTENLRTAQRQGAYEAVLQHADWFGRPWSQINRHLYLLGWVVGAGKTLAVPTLAFALNKAARAQLGSGAPRVDRVLLLCKDQATRDQAVTSFAGDKDKKSELVEYGIVAPPPRVLAITHSGQMARGITDQYDLVVACAAMLFEANDRDADWSSLKQQFLARFPLIVIDEPHYANDQALQIVEAAPASLVFGTTGSPIDNAGRMLNRMVAVSVFDYDMAVRADQSMAQLAEDDERNLIFQHVQPTSADVLIRGELEEGLDKRAVDYEGQWIPKQSVAEAVVHHVREMDGLMDRMRKAQAAPLLGEQVVVEPAPHRLEYHGEVVADLTYDVHAMIVVESVPAGKQMVSLLNDMFDRRRDRYPMERGYRAELVHAANELTGQGGKPLTSDHPWMRVKNAKELKGKRRADAKCARFLVVVGMAREGVDNPYCGVIGVACSINSRIEAVQRPIGRQLRGVQEIDRDGTLHVPPEEADTVRILSHESFDNRKTIESGIRFVLNMSDELAVLPTVSDLKAGADPEPVVKGDKDRVLTPDEETKIAGHVIKARQDDVTDDEFEAMRKVLGDVFGGPQGERKEKVDEWIDTVDRHPDVAWSKLNLDATVDAHHIVMREESLIDWTFEQVITFVRNYLPRLEPQAREIYRTGNELGLHLLKEWLSSEYQQHRIHQPQPWTSLKEIRLRLMQDSFETFGAELTDKKRVYQSVNQAIKNALGVGADETVQEGSKWDVPQVHHVLTDQRTQRQMKGFIRRRLIQSGAVPAWKEHFAEQANVQAWEPITVDAAEQGDAA